MTRATDSELRRREAAALELLAAGAGTALAAQTLSERYGVSLRTARRYIAAARLELTEPLTPHELDAMAMVTLHRLELLAGQATMEGDKVTAIRASRALATAVAQMRKAVTAPVTRFRLPATGAYGAADPPPF